MYKVYTHIIDLMQLSLSLVQQELDISVTLSMPATWAYLKDFIKADVNEQKLVTLIPARNYMYKIMTRRAKYHQALLSVYTRAALKTSQSIPPPKIVPLPRKGR